jgi:hypothetical protein
MFNNTIVALLIAAGTITAATQAQELLNTTAPAASVSVSDANLRQIYQEAKRLVLLEDVPLVEALTTVSQGLNRPEVLYTVSGKTVKAETEWSCRLLTEEDVWVRITDC